MHRAPLAPIFTAAVLVAALGCAKTQEQPREPDAGPLQVAATVAPHAWLVERIAGDDFHVVTVLPVTADPHSHTPTDAEVSRLARSRVLFRSGVPFENGSWLPALSARGVRLVDLRRGIELLEDAHGHEHGDHDSSGTSIEGTSIEGDPHTWTSPRRLALQASIVSETLAELRPERAAEIRRRSRQAEGELKELDAELRLRLAGHRGREFFVHHPSWSYFAADYGLLQVALEAGGSEPSDAQLTEWLRRARAAGVRVVFSQPQSADRTPRVAAAALSARLEPLDPLAPDVPRQLRVTAERLLASWVEPGFES